MKGKLTLKKTRVSVPPVFQSCVPYFLGGGKVAGVAVGSNVWKLRQGGGGWGGGLCQGK